MSSSLALIDISVRPFTHDELLHIDSIVNGGASSGDSFEDIVNVYREFNWSKLTVTVLHSIYKGPWSPVQGAKGKATGMPADTNKMKKGDLIALLKKRMEVTLASIRSRQQENVRTQLQPLGVIIGDSISVLTRMIDGYDRGLFFRSAPSAQAAAENLNRYISGEDNDLRSFRILAEQRNPPDIVEMFIRYAENERKRSNLLLR